jgi:hypothetical protein
MRIRILTKRRVAEDAEEIAGRGAMVDFSALLSANSAPPRFVIYPQGADKAENLIALRQSSNGLDTKKAHTKTKI